MSQEQSSPETTAALRERDLRTESHRTLRRAGEILRELANEIERTASHENADRCAIIADNVGNLRATAGFLGFTAATAFSPFGHALRAKANETEV